VSSQIIIKSLTLLCDQVYKAVKPIGTISNRKDGKYKKTAPGQWERVTEEGQKEKQPEQKEKAIKTEEKIIENETIKDKNNVVNGLKDFLKNPENTKKQFIDNIDSLRISYQKLNEIIKKNEPDNYPQIKKAWDEIEANSLYKNPICEVLGIDKKTITTKTNEEYLEELNKIDTSPMKKGKHWGSATTDNDNYLSFVSINSKVYNPLNEMGYKKNELTLKGSYHLLDAIKERNYAQKIIKNFPKEKYPEVYRGMSLSEKAIEKILSGDKKEINLTGCTAFTMQDEIADHYANSEWTKSKGGFGKEPVIIKMKRSDDFDNSLGMWHTKQVTKPPYEIVSGLSKLKINSVKQVKKYEENGDDWLCYEIECEGIM
jgi:hypothetical protein